MIDSTIRPADASGSFTLGGDPHRDASRLGHDAAHRTRI